MFKKDYIVRLNTIQKVKEFSNLVSHYDADLYLVSGRYVIDAKSIMGIFSLDLTKDIMLNVETKDETLFDRISNELSKFILKEV